MEKQRRIRSFVLRQGRLTQGQEQALSRSWSRYGLEPTSALNFSTLFGNDNPVTLEIGFGMGDSLADQAAARRDENFIGIEVHRPGVGHLLIRAEEAGLTNLKVINDDSVPIITELVADGSLAGLQVFFPDPWHKKRHHKRRLIQSPFMDLAAAKLATGGLLHVATDWVPYAEEVEALMRSHPAFEIVPAPARPGTKFEARGERLGHTITDLAARRL